MTFGPRAAALFGAMLVAIGAATAQRPDPAQLRQLADAWAFVRYYHPWAATRAEFNVDSSAVQAIRSLRESSGEAAFRRAIETLVAGAHDPATRLLGPPAAGARWRTGEAAGPPAAYRLADGTVVVALHSYAALSNRGLLTDYDGKRLAAITTALAEAKALILDVRTDDTAPLPGGDDDTDVVREFIADILRLTTKKRLTPFAERSTLRTFFSERNGSASAALRVDARRPVSPGGNAREIPAVLVANANSVLPGYAAALLHDGLAALVTEGDLGDAPFAHCATRAFGPALLCARRADLVDADGRGSPSATEIVAATASGSDAALNRAAELARVGRPFAVRPGLAASTIPLAEARGTPPITLPPGAERQFALLKTLGALGAFLPEIDANVVRFDSLSREFVPRLDAATTIGEYHLALAHLTNRLRDSHAILNTPQLQELRGPARLPALLEFVEGRLTVVSPAHDSLQRGGRLDAGDVILSIDGEDGRANALRIGSTYSSSSPARAEFDAERSAGRGKPGSIAAIVVETTDGTRRSLQIARVPSGTLLRDVNSRAEPAIRLLTPEIGYMDVSRVPGDSFTAAFKSLVGAKGIIFDWRNSTDRTYEVVSRLMRPDSVEGTNLQPYLGSLSGGELRGTTTRTTWCVCRHPTEHYGGVSVILQGPHAQSSMEVNGDLLRRANATPFIGGPTSGTLGGAGELLVPGGIRLQFTSGMGADRKGLQPDVPVSRTRAGVRAGRDEVLDAAVRYVQNAIRSR